MLIKRYAAIWLVLFLALAGCARADRHHHDDGDHAEHHAMMSAQQGYTRTQASYSIPDVELVDQHGRRVGLQDMLAESEPYALNFIFTSCTTICPIMSAEFFQLQQELRPEEQLHMISISIDPEYDSPTVLRQYAERLHAGANWHFLTGDVATIKQVQMALAGYVANKMDHRPFTLIKVKGAQQWFKVDGFASGTELAAEYRRLEAAE